MIYLASSGDEAKIWDVPSFSLLEEFNPCHGSLSDITWSHDGYSIASCCSTDRTVYLRLTKTSQSVPLDSIMLQAGCQCLDYNSSSRFLLCGCVDGSVHIWDRKSKAIKKSYINFKSPVTVARWNWNDTYISVGLENGNILLYNVASNQASSPLVAPSVNTIRQLRYNPYHKSSLVSASEDGAVNFWDMNTCRLVNAYLKAHHAPARDLVFSPINDYLMVSVGLDMRMVFFDVKIRTPVRIVLTEHPLTSVEIMPDGVTVVAGTTQGKVFFYDVRQPSTPVYNFTAHKSSIKRLSFVKKDSEKGDSSSQSLRRQLPTTPMLATDTQNQNSNNASNNAHYQSPRNKTYLSGLEIFSPVSNVNKSSTSVTEKTSSEKSWMHNLSKSQTGDTFTTVNKSSTSVTEKTSSEKSWMHNLSKSQTGDTFTTGDGVFSPLRLENSHSINSTHNRSSVLSNNSFLTQILGSIESGNKDPLNNHSNNLYTIEVKVDNINPVTVDKMSSFLAKEASSESSPRYSLLQRGIGASPSVQQLFSQRVDDIDSASFPNRTSPSNKTSASSAISNSLPQNRVSFENRPEVLGAASGNGGALSQSPQNFRPEQGDPAKLSTVKNGENCGTTSSSPSRSPNSSQQRTRSSLEPGATSSLPVTNGILVHHLVQDLLREQFQEHKEQLKTEIRAMLGHPGYNTLGAAQTSNSTSLPSQGNPGMFHAEFIRNLVREELEDVKDFIHKEFWCVQVELIKQIFKLQKRIEAGLAECAINPILLDEINKLREENARLKRTF